MFNFFKKKKVVVEQTKNLKLISLCLAFEVANADRSIDKKEKKIILNKIKDTIDLTILTEKEIFDVIKEKSESEVSFYGLIRDINENLNKVDKIDVLKMLWEVAYADGVLDIYEEKIIRRSAEMLGINPSIVLQTKEEFKNR